MITQKGSSPNASPKLCLVIGSAAISGGTYVIAQHAAALKRAGFDVTLAIQDPFTSDTLLWHDELPGLYCIPLEEALRRSYDFVIATWWKTSLELWRLNAPRLGYFVQSIESRFYPEQDTALRALVDTTYDLPVAYVTEATWIQRYLGELHNQTAALVRNGIRKDIYSPDSPTVSPKLDSGVRVLVEGHFKVPFKNTALAVKLAKEAGAQSIWVLTGSPARWIPGVERVFSRVPMKETAAIYRSCDVLLKLSTVEGMFGPPLEMFHCGGTSIVFDVSGHDEYIVDGMNALVVKDRDTDEVVTQLRRLDANPSLLSRLKEGALATATAWPDWDESSASFVAWVESCLSGPVSDREACRRISEKAFEAYVSAERLKAKPQKPSILWTLATSVSPSLAKTMKVMEPTLEVATIPRVVR